MVTISYKIHTYIILSEKITGIHFLHISMKFILVMIIRLFQNLLFALYLYCIYSYHYLQDKLKFTVSSAYNFYLHMHLFLLIQ